MTSAAAPVAVGEGRMVGSLGEVLRDIARGGIAGAVAGIVVGGVVGRIVMRLAAVVVPSSAGRFTENGNQIGDITLAGTVGLILFGGLFFGTAGGTLWVVVSPWIPGSRLQRAILAMPVAVALTGLVLIHGDNPDFRILNHDVFVVAMLVALLAVAGLVISLVDTWLDQRLPRPGASVIADALYGVLTLLGALLILPFVVQAYLADATPVGVALIGVGLATLAWWAVRRNGHARPPRTLQIFGGATLLSAIVAGLLDLAPEVARALGNG